MVSRNVSAVVAWCFVSCAVVAAAHAEVAGTPGPKDLTIAAAGNATAVVVVSPAAGPG